MSKDRNFLGLCNFYQSFVPGFATTTATIIDLEKKGREWNWTMKCKMAFKVLKERMLQYTVLVIPDPDPAKPYVLYTDAYNVGVGAVLFQMGDNGHLRLVACRSN